jgi:putative transcriptional regulator
MTRRRAIPQKLAGSLRLAHPGLLDPNFRRSIILLSQHSEDGAMGVIINRPIGRTLAELSGDFALGELADVPVFSGGPVKETQLILSAWESSEEAGVFKLYFGLDPEKAAEMKRSNTELVIRAFLGYSGWTGGQLEGELRQNSWVVAPVEGGLLQETDGPELWRTVIGRISPELRLLAEAPDDPTLN